MDQVFLVFVQDMVAYIRKGLEFELMAVLYIIKKIVLNW